MGYEYSLLSKVNKEAEILHEIKNSGFNLELDRNKHIDAIFSDNSKLSSLLPKKVSIVNTPQINIPESA